MLTATDNQLITQVGPQTPLGRLMRRYWLPVCMSSQLSKPDGDPVRVRLLGENFVAFRDRRRRRRAARRILHAPARVPGVGARRGRRNAVSITAGNSAWTERSRKRRTIATNDFAQG